MSSKPAGESDKAPKPLLPRYEQALIAAAVTLSLVAMAAYWVQQSRLRGRLIEIDGGPAPAIDFQLDINRAAWPELTLLPDVGETLARRIVASRETHGPFFQHDELLRVEGVGPKTVNRIRPYLLPIHDSQVVAGP